MASVRQKKLSQEKKCDGTSSRYNEVSTRVREIAKSTLHLSDLDIDELFSDKPKGQVRGTDGALDLIICRRMSLQDGGKMYQLSECVESQVSEVNLILIARVYITSIWFINLS